MFNRKKLFIFMILGLLMIVATACGSNAAGNSDDTSNKNDSDSQNEQNADENEQNKQSDNGETYTIKMATPSTPKDSNTMAFLEFKKIVEEETDGQIQVDVLHSGQLGGHSDYIDALQIGSIQAAELSTSVLSGIHDKFMIFSMPYIAKNMDHMTEVVNGEVGNQLSDVLEDETGIQITGWMVRGARNVYSSKGPIETVEDFKGLKIRVMESPAMIEAMNLLGAKPTPIAADERYMALQTGVVDAAENSVALVLTEKEYEVTDYISFTEHFLTPNVIAMSSQFLDKLPEDLRQTVLDASQKAADYAIEEEKRQIDESVEKLKEKGMKINKIDDKSAFIEAVKPVHDEYKEQIGQDLFDAFLK
ncbi:TRAP transporter substrate-binding protein [Gracilibacillus sp. YIM 98692]|uniref:TRAP transporter substrate-binding protein n=1 Tax=Gracilibacillus sp. YIM 98692 TaxID=2663532 RepID=UPI0013D209B4|nr:TRAP transporter substrate-binding protein [Gracilibacillus sp. YIM 98692]